MVSHINDNKFLVSSSKAFNASFLFQLKPRFVIYTQMLHCNMKRFPIKETHKPTHCVQSHSKSAWMT